MTIYRNNRRDAYDLGYFANGGVEKRRGSWKRRSGNDRRSGQHRGHSMIPIIRGSKGEEGKTHGALEPEDGGSFCKQEPLLELERMDKKKILIVDDDQNLAMALKTSFELQGFNVFVGLDGPQGLKLAEARSPT